MQVSTELCGCISDSRIQLKVAHTTWTNLNLFFFLEVIISSVAPFLRLIVQNNLQCILFFKIWLWKGRFYCFFFLLFRRRARLSEKSLLQDVNCTQAMALSRNPTQINAIVLSTTCRVLACFSTMGGKILLRTCQFDSVITSFLFPRLGDHISGLCSICRTDSNESGDKIISVSVHSTEYFMTLAKAIDSTISHLSARAFISC